jgi:hypothetical protein
MFPFHGSGSLVVVTDVLHEFSSQLGDGSERAARDDITLDLAEPLLDLVEPRRVGRSEVQVDLGRAARKSLTG